MIAYPFGVGGECTRLLEAGPEQGSPVLLLHGVGARADRWRNNIEPLAEAGLRVIAVDLPGHGFASKSEVFDYSAPGYADFIVSLMSGLRIDKAALIGTSLGGHVAGSLACRFPERVRALVLVGAVGLVPVGPEARSRVEAAIADTSRSGIGMKLRGVVLDPSLVTDEWVREEHAINNSPGAAEAFRSLGAYFGSRLDEDVVGAALAGLVGRIPIQLVWGEQDRSVALDIGQRAQQILGGVPLATISGAAHAPYFERPGEFNAICLEFLQSCGVIPGA